MEKFVVTGGKPLHGEVSISGAKNAAVAIIPAVILCDEPCQIENIPNISDVTLISRILQQIGANVRRINKSSLYIDPTHIKTYSATTDLVRGMRASYYLLGALLGKYGKAKVALPGGCNFGARPIDQHLKGFEAMGAATQLVDGAIIEASLQTPLQGTQRQRVLQLLKTPQKNRTLLTWQIFLTQWAPIFAAQAQMLLKSAA